jgi:hypothetical protein
MPSRFRQETTVKDAHLMVRKIACPCFEVRTVAMPHFYGETCIPGVWRITDHIAAPRHAPGKAIYYEMFSLEILPT